MYYRQCYELETRNFASLHLPQPKQCGLQLSKRRRRNERKERR